MRGVCIFFAVILILLSALFTFSGFDKLMNYENPANSEFYKIFPYGSSTNAYVGGDAYNFIINAGQATAYFVLAVGSLISAMLLFVCVCLITIKKRQAQHSKELNANLRKLVFDLQKKKDFDPEALDL